MQSTLRMLAPLMKRGLVEPYEDTYQPYWSKVPVARICYRISAAGLAAIGKEK